MTLQVTAFMDVAASPGCLVRIRAPNASFGFGSRLRRPGRRAPRIAGQRCVPAALALLLVFAAIPAAAQQGESGIRDLVRRRIGLAPRLLLVLAPGDTVTGQSAGWLNEYLLLRDGRSFSLDAISAIEVLEPRTGEFARRGAWLGGVLGAGLSVFAAGSDEEEDAVRRVGLAISGTGAGMLAGAALGALVGARVHTAEVVYRVRPQEGRGRGGATMVAYERGPRVGSIRTRLAVTPFIGFAKYGFRARVPPGAAQYLEVGITRSREAGLQLQYALGPRSVVRFAVAAIRTHPKFRSGELEQSAQVGVLQRAEWLARSEAALELRIRADVPGYFVVALDGLYNPHGYILGAVPLEESYARVRPLGIDTGVHPRLGLGAGFDVFETGDRRLRFEWVYRLGLYREPAAADAGFEATRITRDSGFTIGVHLPLARPQS